MKKLILILSLIILLGCTSKSQIKPTIYTDKGSTVVLLKDSIVILNDSIAKLNKRTTINSAQFVALYKYERLYKYYRICVKNPSQWKYYKGWSIRVFEQ